MVKKTDPGYARAIEALNQKFGEGASYLGRKMGRSKQNVYAWSKAGFPPGLVPKIAKIVGLTEAEIAPPTVHIKVDWKLYVRLRELMPDRVSEKNVVNFQRR
jgi:hypothetical protein